MKKKLTYPILLITCYLLPVTCYLLMSCSEPHALYGTWADNRGNSISFFNDNDSFLTRVESGSSSLMYEGNFTVLLNALTFNCTNMELRVVTEWDIRGNILYLNWPLENGTTMMLTLYKISN